MDQFQKHQAFHSRIDSSRNSRKMYFLVWWITCAPKFLPTTQFQPLPFLSISVFRQRDSTRSCLCSLRLQRRPFARSSLIFSISSGSMSVAFTFAYTLPQPCDIILFKYHQGASITYFIASLPSLITSAYKYLCIWPAFPSLVCLIALALYFYNNIMGSTDSRVSPFRLDQQYRLIRRFISDFYSAEITVVQHKQTKQQYALKQSVLQFNPQLITQQMQARKALSNRNFISLCHFWMENDLGICSNLFKLHALFEYHENTLEDVMNEREDKGWSDAQVLDFVRQMISGLSFLQRNQMVYLLAGARSIAIAEEENAQRATDDEAVTDRRALREIGQQQRCSLVDLNKRCPASQLAKQRLTDLRSPRKRRVYKLFEPLQGLTGTRSLHNLQNYMQVPLHPHLSTSQDQLLSQPLIKLQNLFTVIFLALSLAEGSDIFQLDLFKNGRLSLDKLRSTIESLKDSHPRSSCQLLKLLTFKGEKEYRTGHFGVKLKEFSFLVKKEQARSGSQQKLLKIMQRKVHRAISRKRISLLQI